jgi:MFS family permease
MSLVSALSAELGLSSFRQSASARDLALLFLSRLLRLFAFGAVAPILILFLRLVGLSDQQTGLFLSCTLLGDVVLSLVITWSADWLGRRKMLALGSLLMAASGFVFASQSSFYFLLAAAVVGIISRKLFTQKGT